jgi:hypothetical protein
MVLALHMMGAYGFVPSLQGLRRPVGASLRQRASRGPSMQVAQWVGVAAKQQGRDPARLEPLKLLPDVIVIRPIEVTLPASAWLVCAQS